jgi:signal transduction histidine kinase
MSDAKTSFAIRKFLAWTWLVFTVALATWQFVFVSRLLANPEMLSSSEHGAQKFLRMVHYENLTLILSLILGGGSLLVLLRREKQKVVAQNQFFATFTHEIKTSLAAIKLRVETLQGADQKELSLWSREELLQQLTKLEIQLENSLHLAQGAKDPLFIEPIGLKDLLLSLGAHPEIQVHLKKDAIVQADRRALESVFKNIFLNSSVHGKAENIWIEAQTLSLSHVRVSFRDDGQGLKTTTENLGVLFHRPLSTSGSGIGLYLIKSLAERLGGTADFSSPEEKGFQVNFDLPGKLTEAARG